MSLFKPDYNKLTLEDRFKYVEYSSPREPKLCISKEEWYNEHMASTRLNLVRLNIIKSCSYMSHLFMYL